MIRVRGTELRGPGVYTYLPRKILVEAPSLDAIPAALQAAGCDLNAGYEINAIDQPDCIISNGVAFSPTFERLRK